MTVEYLDLSDFLAIAAAVTGLEVTTLIRVTRLSLADSALHAPAAGFRGVELYPDFVDKAVVLLVRLSKNQPASRRKQAGGVGVDADVRRGQRLAVAELPRHRRRRSDCARHRRWNARRGGDRSMATPVSGAARPCISGPEGDRTPCRSGLVQRTTPSRRRAQPGRFEHAARCWRDAHAVEDLVAVAVELESGETRFFLTWGRIQERVDPAPLAALVLRQASTFDLAVFLAPLGFAGVWLRHGRRRTSSRGCSTSHNDRSRSATATRSGAEVRPPPRPMALSSSTSRLVDDLGQRRDVLLPAGAPLRLDHVPAGGHADPHPLPSSTSTAPTARSS